jgi:uncharacterized protein (TIGR03435 family)
VVAAGFRIAGSPAQTQDAPDWQAAAGGKMSFEVASVKPASAFAPPTFPLSSENGYTPGGRLTAVFPLPTYITFAYKLWLSPEQMRAVIAGLPKWVGTDLYQVQAKGPENATKDQMRLMMQSLLAERFQLKVHFETKEVAVLALVLDRPGKLGPKLRPHSEGPPCPEYEASGPMPLRQGDVFPGRCGVTAMMPPSPGQLLVGSRDTTMQLLANMIQTNGSMAAEVSEPVVDRTGLAGTFDYTVEYSGQFGPRPPADADTPPAPEGSGTTFRQALRDQLGLKLVPAKAPIQTIVVDHIERPSEN